MHVAYGKYNISQKNIFSIRKRSRDIACASTRDCVLFLIYRRAFKECTSLMENIIFTEKYIFYKKGVRVERMMLASGRG